MDSMRLNQDMLANAIENSLLGELEKQQTRCEHRCPDDSMSTKAVRKKMGKKRIEEIRKSLNIDDSLQFDFAEELVLWIIGGFGPVDMQPDGIKFEYVPLSDFPNEGKALLLYITACDAAEGFSVYRFKSPVLAGRCIKEVHIYLIQCTNNGTTYYASANLDALRSFVLCANEEIRNNRLKNIK